MDTEPDPGWRDAVAAARRIALLRPVDATLLITLRGITVFGLVTSLMLVPVSWLASAGVEEPSTNRTAASVLVAVVVIGAGLSLLLATQRPDVSGTVQLAAFAFRVTVFRVILGAAIGGAGLITAFLSGSPVLGIVGTAAAVVLIALAAPTAGRVDAWQDAIDETDSPLSVREVLDASFGPRSR